MRNKLIVLFLFIITGISFADDVTNNIHTENGIESHRHSIGLNFGSTIF